MAVAARTYAVKFKGRHAPDGYDFCATTHCQDTLFGSIPGTVSAAVEATEGELLWFRGSPVAAFYSKDCGGRTESASAVWPDLKAPYLISRDDPYCPRQPWTTSFRKDEVSFKSLRVVNRSASGRAARLVAGGDVIAASGLRFAIGRGVGWDRIRSDLYQVTDAGDRFLFEGRGAGHGVGLCQLGADRMGKSYREILAFYYPGTAAGVTAAGLSWTRMGGERVTVMSTAPAQDRFLVALADRTARVVEERTRMPFSGARIQIFPTIAAFRDATGEPGFVAASTRGRVIRLQPVSALRGTAADLVLHEMLHVAIESRARPGLPVWFREGLVGYLKESQRSKVKSQKSKPAPPQDSHFRGTNARRAYALAREHVEFLVALLVEARVLSWIGNGLPPELAAPAR